MRGKRLWQNIPKGEIKEGMSGSLLIGSKEALMLERGYPEVSPHDFYRELFPAGSLQQEPEDGKGNIIATQIRPSGKGRTRQWVIDDSLKMLDKVIGDRFGLIPPISFYGKSHTKENAHELFAVVVDVDYVGKQQLKNLLKQFGNGVQLRPDLSCQLRQGRTSLLFLAGAGSVVSKPGSSACRAKRSSYPAAME